MKIRPEMLRTEEHLCWGDSQGSDLNSEAFASRLFNLRFSSRSESEPSFAAATADKQLSDADKFDLQQYITRCYGSLTTFNVLFKNEDDQFRTSS